MTSNPFPHNNTAANQSPLKMHGGMRGARYGEVLLITGQLKRLQVQATVYNTLGLNECPTDLWYALDPDAIKREYKASAVILNGPRYFLMDEIGSADVRQEIFTFGELQMRHMATVSIPLGRITGGFKNKPYMETTVNRTTTYVFDKGSEIYELVAPDGTTYLMQSYSLIIDTALNEEALKMLGVRLHLPEGWSYRVRQLEQECVLHVNGKAHLIQDDLTNSYQRLE